MIELHRWRVTLVKGCSVVLVLASSGCNRVQPPAVSVSADVETVHAQGNGYSAAEAVAEAIRVALRRVNGPTTELGAEQFKQTLALAQGNDDEALRAPAFARRIVERSGGALDGFKIQRLDGPDRRGFYQADVEAQVARNRPNR